jgi:molybdopterin molybdotransferase
LGVEVVPLGIAPDDISPLSQIIRQGLEYEVLLLCGGVSMGEFDLVKDVLQRFGCQVLFESVAIQPGKPMVAATHARGLVFGLPGNPASAMVTFWLFVRPTLRRLLGLEDGFWHGCLEGVLAAPLPGAKTRDRFLPAEVEFRGGEVLVKPIPAKGSHDLAAFARGTALVRIPAGASPLPAGGGCQILPLADWRVVKPRHSP